MTVITTHLCSSRPLRARHAAAAALIGAALLSAACTRTPKYRTFETPEAAVQALTDAVKAGNLDEVTAIFGPEGQSLIDSSDPATARRNQQVFSAAAAEHWHLAANGDTGRVLVIGNERWPFPVPLVKDGSAWRFDTEAGKEEVLARRIGRNELGVIRICRTYVLAQRLYAARGHDDKQPGLYAMTVRSDPGRQNGLYWPPVPGGKRSPLGILVAEAAGEDAKTAPGAGAPVPFHGYFYRILTKQGPAAAGGARDYVASGELSGGFALVAWPAHYDESGVMTFIVNQDGIVREKDLGSATDAAARKMSAYDPDASWAVVAPEPREQAAALRPNSAFTR